MVRFIDVAVFVLLQIALKFERGESIQCFVCNSRSDPRCADPIQTDWQGADDQDSDNPHDSSDGGLEPLECYLANRYSKGIQAVSDLVFRGFGHPRLGVPDLWATTAAVLSGPGGNRGPKGNRGSPWGYYGGQREDDEATGCHKVVYTDNNGDSVVDRGCAKDRVANTDPCSALDSATSSNDNGNNGNTGSSSYGGHGGGNSGSGNGGVFDLSQISVDFCEVCNDNDGCNRATNLSINSLFILALSISNVSLKFV